MFKQNTLTKAIGAAAFGLAAVGAQAAVTAIATDQLTNFTVSVSSGTIGFADGNATRTSAASATFNGTGPSNSVQSTPPAGADVAPATAGPGPFPANNAGNNQAAAVTFTGGFGDSQVFGSFLDPAGSTVNATAQSGLPDGMAGSATSQGRVQTAGNVLLTLSGTEAATFTISFTDDLNLFTQSTVMGGRAVASSSARFRLSTLDGDTTVFDFSPNGVLQTIAATNTTELSDPFNLNNEISALGLDTTSLNPGPLFFSARTTTPLAAGTFRLDLLIQKNSGVTQQANPVPEPSSVLLMALGLVAAGVATHRKPRA